MWDDVFRRARLGLGTGTGGGTGGSTAVATTISIMFDGAGAPLQTGSAGAVEITFPCRIISCRMYAGNVTLQPAKCSAIVELQLTTVSQYAGGGRLSLTGGTNPNIANAVTQDVSVDGWVTQLDPQDVLLYRLASVAGDATWLSLQIGVRRIDAPLTNVQVADNASNLLTDTNGTVLNFRTQ